MPCACAPCVVACEVELVIWYRDPGRVRSSEGVRVFPPIRPVSLTSSWTVIRKAQGMSDSVAATAPPSQHVSELFDGYEISPTVVTTSLGDRPDDMELPPAHMDSMASFAALAGSPKLADRRRKLSNPELKAQPAKDARNCRGGVAPTIERPQISLGPSAAEVWAQSPSP